MLIAQMPLMTGLRLNPTDAALMSQPYLLRFIDEGMEGSPHTFKEEVMPIEELAVLLEQVHGNGQHAP